MASAAVILIILSCGTYHYFHGRVVKSFATLMYAILACVVAFGYFEVVANLIISRSGDGSFESLVPWAQPLCLILLGVVSFAVLQLVTDQITATKVDLGVWPERVGRAICGILIGMVFSGLLLTALVMAPLPSKYPYQRFSATSRNFEKPEKKVFLSADGFTTGLFSMLSKGSFSAIRNERSFATLHADFLNQSFLNRQHRSKDSPLTLATSTSAIEVPPKKAVWAAPDGLKDAKGNPAPQESKHRLTIVRLGMSKKLLKEAGTFTLSQLRLVCAPKINMQNPFAGKGKVAHPVGYMKKPDMVQTKQLGETIKLESAEFGKGVKWIDFVFDVPSDSSPVLVEFKQNTVVELPSATASEEAPEVVPFIPLSSCDQGSVELEAMKSAKVYGVTLGTGIKFLGGFSLSIKDTAHWSKSETDGSIRRAAFEGNSTDYVQAAMRKVEPDKEEESTSRRGRRGRRRRRASDRDKIEFSDLLKPLEEYKLVSLKCNSPATDAAISGRELPVLVELTGAVHHCVGVFASGQVGGEKIYEIDYCSATVDKKPGGLVVGEDGAVAQPFPDSIWLTAKAGSIDEFYVLYLVKSGQAVIISEVRAGDSGEIASFKKKDGLFVK